MRTIFIGDVHGMLDTLDDLLAQLQLSKGDRLIFLGDLIDKGPNQIGVLRRVIELQSRPDIDIQLVCGNHEDKHIRYRRNLTLRPKVAREQADNSPALVAFSAEAHDKDWHLLESALPFIRLPEFGLLALHGGIPGDMAELPDETEFENSTGKERDRIEKIWRTRFIDRDTGHFLGLGKALPGDPFWAEVYDGRFGHVVFGHQPFMHGPARYAFATGIDTGAVHGGQLTALVVRSADRTEDEFLQSAGYPYSVGHLTD
ncbi:MAG: phosphatase [Ponticaulis sp.]|nr:phosphatase [Ponticaulis sp.]|tara:strand:+ start:162329 stop:163102 length:774 start_codon:yes stop_codon:yes gene_type:complete